MTLHDALRLRRKMAAKNPDRGYVVMRSARRSLSVTPFYVKLVRR